MSFSISVIIPFFNAEQNLSRCIESLLAQTLSNIQIILVDDASTDNSPEISKNYAELYPQRIINVRQKYNKGPGAARNAGIKYAEGQYIAFVDSDDYVESDMFLNLYKSICYSYAEIAVCGICKISNNDKKIYIPNGISSSKDLLESKTMLSPPWNKLFSRSFIEKNGIYFPESRMSEDMAFSFKAACCANKIISVDNVLYRYIQNISGISFNMKMRSEALKSIEDIKIFLTEKNFWEKWKKQYLQVCYLHLFYYPTCLVVIDALIKGKNRRQILRQAPRYYKNLAQFILRQIL